MSFIDSYKSLDKLCGELYGSFNGVSSYIEDMKGQTDGSVYVAHWRQELETLKHYRRVRNQIVHEPDCTEDNMCDDRDAEWLERFKERIMTGDDPLAQYHRAKSPSRRVPTASHMSRYADMHLKNVRTNGNTPEHNAPEYRKTAFSKPRIHKPEQAYTCEEHCRKAHSVKRVCAVFLLVAAAVSCIALLVYIINR